MDQISLAWERYPDSEIFSVTADGLSEAQLEFYAHQVGFLAYQHMSGFTVLFGYVKSQRDALRDVLEAAGYQVDHAEVWRFFDHPELEVSP